MRTLVPSDSAEAPVQLFTTTEVSNALRISVRKTWSLIASGDLESVRIGRSVRVTSQALVAFVRSATVPGAVRRNGA